MKWSDVVTDPRELYRAAKQTYRDPFKAKVAFMFSMSVLIVPGWIWLSSQPIGQIQDYSTVAVVLIILGIAIITMLNYRLVLRKELVAMRARRLLRELKNERGI